MREKEGWVDNKYIRVYDSNDRGTLKIAYDLEQYLPGHEIIGSDDLGYALCIEVKTGFVYWVPFVPMDIETRELAYKSINDAYELLLQRIKINTDITDPKYGKEVHYKKPILLGGDISDKDNVVFAPREIHQQWCGLYNKIYKRMKTEWRGSKDRMG